MKSGGEFQRSGGDLALRAVAGLLSGLSGCAGAAPAPAVQQTGGTAESSRGPLLECPAPTPDDATRRASSDDHGPGLPFPLPAPKPGEIVGRVVEVGPSSLVIETESGATVSLDDAGELEVYTPSWVALGRASVLGVKSGSLRVAPSGDLKSLKLAAGMPVRFRLGSLPRDPEPPSHDCCKGYNECKGQGNCKTDGHDCAGRNECKGQGGCKPADCS